MAKWITKCGIYTHGGILLSYKHNESVKLAGKRMDLDVIIWSWLGCFCSFVVVFVWFGVLRGVVLFVFCQLDIWEERTTIKKMPPSDSPLSKYLRQYLDYG